jgi:hypothetical protein
MLEMNPSIYQFMKRGNEVSAITPEYILINLIILAILLVGGYFVIRKIQGGGKLQNPFHFQKSGNRVTGDKTSVIAIVAGVTKNLRNPGEAETYYVICNYKDPDTRLSTTFTSRELKVCPGRDIIGKPVKVTLDPTHPGTYTVDIDSIL